MREKKKIIVAMSGGVDSSVAAKILKDEGHEIMGVFLHFWKDDEFGDKENKCCSTKAFMDARRVAEKIGIKLYTMNFAEEFKKNIVDYFLDFYARGLTPNPCVRCNKFVKLGLLLERARDLGYDYVASGHYVRTMDEDNSVRVLKGRDEAKDQSYFLYKLSQDEFRHLIFPIGGLEKHEVRKMARKWKLPVAEKKESQEICFVPGSDHNEFLKRYLKLEPGDIILKQVQHDGGGEEKKIGEHQGLPLYTIGQRKGIEIGGIGPFYASGFDYEKNILYVTRHRDDETLYKKSLTARDVNWIKGQEPEMPFECEAVFRYGHKPVEAKVKKEGDSYSVEFKEKQRAVAPGQAIVFYSGEEMIGGGIMGDIFS